MISETNFFLQSEFNLDDLYKLEQDLNESNKSEKLYVAAIKTINSMSLNIKLDNNVVNESKQILSTLDIDNLIKTDVYGIRVIIIYNLYCKSLIASESKNWQES